VISEPVLAGLAIFGPLFLGLALLAKSQGGWLGWVSFSVMLLVALFGSKVVQLVAYGNSYSVSNIAPNTQANTTAAFANLQNTSAIADAVSFALLVIFQLAFLTLCTSIYLKHRKAVASRA
jgi:hypothetical protein